MKEKARRLIKALYRIDGAYIFGEYNGEITDTEMCLLYALDNMEKPSQKELSEEWLISKTTVNSIVKRMEKKGFLTLHPIQGKSREKCICLTEAGKEYADQMLMPMYAAEEWAVSKTLEKYPESFIEAMEYFSQCLMEAFSEQKEKQ